MGRCKNNTSRIVACATLMFVSTNCSLDRATVSGDSTRDNNVSTTSWTKSINLDQGVRLRIKNRTCEADNVVSDIQVDFTQAQVSTAFGMPFANARNPMALCNRLSPMQDSQARDCTNLRLDNSNSSTGRVETSIAGLKLNFTNLTEERYRFIALVQDTSLPVMVYEPVVVEFDNTCSGGTNNRVCPSNSNCDGVEEMSHTCSFNQNTCTRTVDCKSGWSRTRTSGVESLEWAGVTCYRVRECSNNSNCDGVEDMSHTCSFNQDTCTRTVGCKDGWSTTRTSGAESLEWAGVTCYREP